MTQTELMDKLDSYTINYKNALTSLMPRDITECREFIIGEGIDPVTLALTDEQIVKLGRSLVDQYIGIHLAVEFANGRYLYEDGK